MAYNPRIFHPFFTRYRPLLLGVDPQLTFTTTQEHDSDDDGQTPHSDEGQIKLDTDRSFVLYPVGDSTFLLSSLIPSFCLTCFIEEYSWSFHSAWWYHGE